MNPPNPLSVGFGPDHLHQQDVLASSIPSSTVPSSLFPELHDFVISSQDIADMKNHLIKHGLKSSCGLDRASKPFLLLWMTIPFVTSSINVCRNVIFQILG